MSHTALIKYGITFSKWTPAIIHQFIHLLWRTLGVKAHTHLDTFRAALLWWKHHFSLPSFSSHQACQCCRRFWIQLQRGTGWWLRLTWRPWRRLLSWKCSRIWTRGRKARSSSTVRLRGWLASLKRWRAFLCLQTDRGLCILEFKAAYTQCTALQKKRLHVISEFSCKLIKSYYIPQS